MTISNKLTILRMILVIPIIVLFSTFAWYVYQVENSQFSLVSTKDKSQYFLYAIGIVFIISMFSDFLDGYLARKHNKITEFGKLFDPLADKIITTTTLLFLAFFNYSYLICILVIIIRDLVVDGSRNVAAKYDLKTEASIWGKIKTLVQSIAIPLILFFIPLINQKEWWQLLLLNVPIILTTILSIISGILYFKNIYPIIKKDK